MQKGEKHQPPKYVVKAIKRIHEYCKANNCYLCPYMIKREYILSATRRQDVCIFWESPDMKSWDVFIKKYDKEVNK